MPQIINREQEPATPILSDYEKRREERIKENRRALEDIMGTLTNTAGPEVIEVYI